MMTSNSHAPNSQPTPLLRALNDVVAGSYIDIGTDPADPATVMRALSDRGWHGVAMRRDEGQVAELAARQPRDVVLLIGDLDGLSRAMPAYVNFVRIDAGEAETAMLLEAVLPRRPWIVLIRADAGPGRAALQAAGYSCALQDGSAAFFVAPDQIPRAALLAAPIAAGVGIAEAADASVLTRLQAALDVAQARAESRSRQLLDAVRATGQARHDLRAMAEASAWLRAQVDEARGSEAGLRAEVAWLREQMATERSELLGQLLVRADHAAWLHQRLAESEAQLTAELAAERAARREAEHRAHKAEAAIANSRLLRAARKLRGVRHPPVFPPPPLPQPPATPAPALPLPEIAVPGAEPAATADPAPALDPALELAPAAADMLPAPGEPQRGLPASASPPALVATVHQFHAGSAMGDAITNAMLLIRSLLRAQGFQSEIFVESRAAGLEAEFHLLDALPRHAGVVLLVHHSMGFPSFDEVLALPARKVLVYHNITPPALLGMAPGMGQMAEVGRQQLATWRGHVAFALADSEYNAVELRALGFAAVRTCTLLFDVDAMLANAGAQAAGARAGDGIFTVLFVGRVTPSKAQHDLIEAFAVFRSRLGRPCRLVLAGVLNPDEHRYLEQLDDRITALGLEAEVQLTGMISDAELRGWYGQADLYVSLSHHEGFGVPLVEAMTYGVPVLAWPTGAVPYTLGGAGVLLASREPAAVAAEMLAAAARGRSGAAAGRLLAERWALGGQLTILMEALAVAGATPPASAATQALLAGNVRVTLAGDISQPGGGATGLLARIIEAQRPGSVRLLIASERPDHESGPVLVLSGGHHLHVPPVRGDLLAALVSREESLIPAAMAATLNAAFDAVFVPSRSVARAVTDSGVSTPVLNLGHAADHLQRYAALPLHRRHDGPFTFLHVSSGAASADLDVLLAAWGQAFTGADAVKLVVKTSPGQHAPAGMPAGNSGAAPVVLLDADMTAGAMLALYRDADAAVLPCPGDGYESAAAEAMAAGLPLIVTRSGGHPDVCGPDTARLVTPRFAPSGSLATPYPLRVEPDVADLAAALREIRAGAGATRVEAARAAILAASDPAGFTGRLAAATAALLLAPKRPAMRVAWVTTWQVRCGIAEYSRTLLEALPGDRMADLTILADDRSEPGAGVQRAWRLGDDPGNPVRLATAIARADADVVMIQHQPGLLPWPVLATVLDLIADETPRPRVVLLTLHNTRHLLTLDPAARHAVLAALRRVARILVHTLADVSLLDSLGLTDRVTLLAHPAPPPTPAASSVRTLWPEAGPENAPVVGSTGFFLPDKGLGPLIRAVASLRTRWPGIRLRLVNAEYDDPISTAEIAACRRLAAAEGLAVEWHTDFIPLARQAALLTECDLLVLPYQRSLEASSAALRNALASLTPVMVTPLPLFDEAGEAVFRGTGFDPDALAAGMTELLQDQGRRQQMRSAAAAWLGPRAATQLALRLHGLMLGLATARTTELPLDGSMWHARQ